jgi:hypothetical protein
MNDTTQDAAQRGAAGHPRPLAAALFTAVVLTAACGGSDDAPPPPAAPPTPAPTPNPPSVPAPVSATIGAAGGTLNGPDGVQLVIPAGALAQDTTIRIARSSTGAPGAPSEWTAAAPAIEITPHDLAFAQPVTIRMPLTAPAGATETDVLVASPSGDWTAAGATLANGIAEFQRGTLSWYQPHFCAVPIGNTDPYLCNRARENSTLATVPAGGALTRTWATPTLSRWTLTQATTLRITSIYSAAPDCGSARLTIRRRNGAGPALTTLVDQPAAMAAQSANRIGGSATFDLPITAADNGSVLLLTRLTCTRPGRAPQSDGYAHAITVNAPATLPAPVITQQPADVTVQAGQSASFTVAATAPDTLTIAWQQSSDGGATWTAQGGSAATLTLASVAASDSGTRFRARLCNVAGAQSSCIESNAAQLTVTVPAAGWSTPAVIASPAGDDAAAAVPGNGTAFAAWTVAGPNGSRIVVRRTAVGAGWSSAPVEIDGGLASGTSSFDPQLGSAPGGQVVAVWGTFFGGRYGLAANRFDGSGWGSAVELATSSVSGEIGVAVDASARAAAVWQQSSREIYVALGQGGGWSPAVNLNRAGAAGGQPQVAVNASGRGFVSFIEGGAVVAVPIDLAAGTVGAGVTVASGRSIGDHRLGIDAAGGAVVAWIEDMPSGGYDLRAARFAGSGWAAAETLAVGVPFNREIAVAAGGAGQAVVAWLGRDSSDNDAVFARVLVGGSWSAPLQASTPAARRAQAVQVAMNAGGRIVLHWAEGGVRQAWARVFDGGNWRAAQAVQTALDPMQTQRTPLPLRTLSLAPDGSALLTWRESGVNGSTLMGAFLQ